MSTWQPYPSRHEPAEEPTPTVTEFEQPPWQSAPPVADPEPTSQELAALDSGPPVPIDPDLDGDGRLDAAERAYAANRRNRRKWQKEVVTYRGSDGWENHREWSRRVERQRRARILYPAATTAIFAAVLLGVILAGFSLPGWIWWWLPITVAMLVRSSYRRH